MAIDTGELKLTMNPFENFRAWFAAAEKALGGTEPASAMTLATASAQGAPSARIVLYKGLGHAADGQEGFRIFTNFESRKSRDLSVNPNAALVFHWAPLGRQLRVEGKVIRVSDAEADAYFASRARGSRIGAWASPQSQKIQNREELLARVRDVEARFSAEVPRPPNWGGWLLVPELFEFWQAGESRLHDRFVFDRAADGQWQTSRLAP
jgi:pyridoxamine 5'-phosphate oxidase